MNRVISFLFALWVGGAASADGPPVAPVNPVIDDYHGTKIADPYRYMEDYKNADVQRWVKSQAEYAERALKASPNRRAGPLWWEPNQLTTDTGP
ncbi:MAG: hypothetical protein U0795_22785 [Pirellulales bacterium]